MKKLFKTAVCICCSFVLAFSCVFAASADGSAPPKYNDYMQQILDGLGNDDIIPINVIVFLRVGSDKIKAVREDFADRFIEEADKAAYFERLDTGASMRYEYERASAETLDYLNSKDEEFFKAAAEALKISKEDIVFTGAIDWFNDVSKWGTDNIGSMCLKNLTKSKFLELSGSELVSGFFKETDGTVEDFGGKTGAEKDTCTY